MTTLTEVHKSFITWRETRQSRKEKIPDALWQQVASIYPAYPRTIICRRLGLSGSQLKRAMLGDGFATYSSGAKSDAIATKINDTSTTITTCEMILEKNGSRLIVKVPSYELGMTLDQLVRRMPC